MKKPLLHALSLYFGLPLLALLLSFSLVHPALHRPTTTGPLLYRSTPSGPLPQADTTPPATAQATNGQVTIGLSPALLQGHYKNINLEWVTKVNGLPGQKGVLLHRNLSATGPTYILLPLRVAYPSNDEVDLQVVGRLAESPGKHQNAPLFTTHLPLRGWHGDYSIPSAGGLDFTDSNNIFTITSTKALVQFDKQTGLLLHYAAGGAILMGDTAGLRSDLGAADTLEPHLQLFFASTGAQIVIVKAEYTLPAINCLLHLSYTLNAAGDMLVEQTVETDTASGTNTGSAADTHTDAESGTHPVVDSASGTHPAPTLPRFGMSWVLPQDLDSVSWFGADEGAISNITPPVKLSREAASLSGVSDSGPPISGPPISGPPISGSPISSPPNGPVSIFPGVRWLALKGREGQGLRIIADSSLLQLRVLPADTTSGRLHQQGPALGIYKTIYPGTQRRFTYSYKVMSLASAALQSSHPASALPAHSTTPATTHPETRQKKQ